MKSTGTDPNAAFDLPLNTAVFTTKFVVKRGDPILYISHDEEDDGWQFHNGEGGFDEKDAMVVSLKKITTLDPSVCEVADLPPGWYAERSRVGAAWIRKKSPSE